MVGFAWQLHDLRGWWASLKGKIVLIANVMVFFSVALLSLGVANLEPTSTAFLCLLIASATAALNSFVPNLGKNNHMEQGNS